MRRWIALVVASPILLGCQQNPFPATGPLSASPPPPGTLHEKPSPIKAYVLTVPDVMTFRLKEEREYTIQASVPPPGKPIVTATNLPKGAHFYPNTLKFVWMPNQEQANAQTPFVIQISLQSSEDPILTYVQPAVLVVENKALNFQVARIGEEIRIPFTAPGVRIVPAHPNVEWRNQEIVIKASTAGLVSFEAVAVLREGEERSQAFSFWVVP